MLTLILYIFGFIVLSGLMAMIDAAVLSVSPAEIETMFTGKRPGAAALKKLYSHITRAVVVIVAFTNMINVYGPILVGQKAVEIYGDVVIGIITAVLTFGTIVFSEIIPKSLGVHYAPKISRLAAPIIRFFTWALFPVVIFLEWMSRLMQRGNRSIGTEEQIRALVRLGGSAGHIEKDELQMIQRVFRLNDSSAADIMTPLSHVTSFESSMSVGEAVRIAQVKKFSRIPVYDTHPDNVTATVLARDILEAAFEERGSEKIDSLSHPIPVVDGDDKADQLLILFRDLKLHMAAVGETGKTIGIVTLEDVLEELVGEIRDETDE